MASAVEAAAVGASSTAAGQSTSYEGLLARLADIVQRAREMTRENLADSLEGLVLQLREGESACMHACMQGGPFLLPCVRGMRAGGHVCVHSAGMETMVELVSRCACQSSANVRHNACNPLPTVRICVPLQKALYRVFLQRWLPAKVVLLLLLKIARQMAALITERWLGQQQQLEKSQLWSSHPHSSPQRSSARVGGFRHARHAYVCI